MAGMFDDLIPQEGNGQAAPASAGMFDDLIPSQGAAAALPAQGPLGGNPELDPFDPRFNAQKFKENAGGAARNIFDAATFGLGDRLLAYGKSGPVVAPDYSKAQSLLKRGDIFGAMNAGNQALAAAPSQPGQYPDYGTAVAAERAKTAEWAKENPGGAFGAQIVGALAPGTGLARGAARVVGEGAGLLGRIIGGAGAGALYGGASGAGHTDTSLSDAAKNAGQGAELGALVGGGLPVLGSALGAGARAVANFAQPAVAGIGRGASALLRQAAGGQVPERLAQLGPEGTLADASPSMLGVAQGVATRPGEGRDALVNALTARNDARNARLAQDVGTNLGPAQSPIEATQNLQAQRSLLHSYLPQIFAQAGPVDTSSVLSTIGQGLTKAVGPEATVLQKARNWLMDEIQVPRGDGTSYPQILPVSDAERLQNAKMAIDTLIDRGDPGLGVPAGAVSKAQGAIGQVRSQLNQALRDQVPGYSHVMDASSALARQMENIEAGTGALGGGQSAMWPQDLEARLAAMSPSERQAFQIGMRGDIENRVGTQANDLAALKRALGGEQDWNRAKMSTVFGEQPTRNVADAIGREQTFANTYADVARNSQTAQRMAGTQLVDETGNRNIPLNMTMTGLAARAPQFLAQAIYRGITGARNEAVRGDLGRALSATGDYRDALVNALLRGAQGAQDVSSVRGAISSPQLAAALLAGARQQPGPLPFDQQSSR